MKTILYLASMLLIFSSCKKADQDDLFGARGNPQMFGNKQCVNDVIHQPFLEKTPYKKRVFFEDFTPNPSDPCYSTVKARCSYRLDWSSSDECRFGEENNPGLKGLNKCVWKVMTGWDFWANRYSTYKADQVNVTTSDDNRSILRLSVKPNKDYNPSDTRKCGEKDFKKIDSWDEFNTNCEIGVSGITSKYTDSTYHGYSTAYGRIQMVMRLKQGNTVQKAYPAFWMWAETLGKGYPNPATTALGVSGTEPSPIMEIDILEYNGANSVDNYFATVHNWEGSGHTGSVGETRLADLNKWETYGVEWSPGLLRFFVGNCVVHEVRTGDKADNREATKPMTISDAASYILLTFGLGGNHTSGEVNDNYEIDSVEIFDYGN